MFVKSVPAVLTLRNFRLACAAVLVLCVLTAFLSSLHWPLVGDASLMHYVVFLRGQGLVPYRDIVDINLPGAYFFEALSMRCFGAGAPGLRFYDGFLLSCIAAAAVLVAGKRGLFGGIFAGTMFALVHLQDGVAQGGQRNLLMSALLLWSYVALRRAQVKGGSLSAFFLAGLCLGSIATIKPVLAPLAFVLPLMSAWVAHRDGRGFRMQFFACTAGFVLPLAAMFLWLWTVGAAHAFYQICTGLLPLHARLGRQTLPYLFAHCLSPIVLPVALWVILLVLQRPGLSAARAQLLVGIFFTAAGYVLEGKGYPYQRYPLIAMLLLLIGIDLDFALNAGGKSRTFALAIAALCCFVLAPRYAWLTTTFSSQAPFQEALAEELLKSGNVSELSGQVQCLDTFGGCTGVLYGLKVRQSTGFLYDCYLFTPKSDTREQYRAAFLAAFEARRPRVVVETDQFCFSRERSFERLAEWPALARELEQDYDAGPVWRSPNLQHWSSRKDEPNAFKLYIRRR